MLKSSCLESLKDKKNLLAFSAGVDSTALFFLLQDSKINFDIALVNYNTREQSLEEMAYAKELSKKFNLKLHTLNSPKITKNFEARAREIRYDFFNTLIQENQYDNLLTAHHLGDRFEWMLMQFCRGAGCVEIAGMKEIESRENYKLIRPLLHLDKQELLEYLKMKKIKYFEDETNNNQNITRNSFRYHHTQPLLEKHLEGIKKSFAYIDEDRESLTQEVTIHSIKEFSYFKSSQNKRADIFTIDTYLKQHSHLATAKERELLKKNKTVVLGRKFLVNQEHNYVFIVPYREENTLMSKEFKESCRKLNVEVKLRPYLYNNQEVFEKIKELLA